MCNIFLFFDRLNFCNFLDMVPEWYENELTPKLNNETDQISISIFPNQNIPSTSSMVQKTINFNLYSKLFNGYLNTYRIT